MASTALTSFAQQTELLRTQIDAQLDRYSQFGDECPRPLGEAIRYSLLAPGKRLRPILVLFSAEACGSNCESAMPAACAVEMVHAYSLVHDDLPSMDDDDLRRGRATCHKVYGEAMAILAGDALLTQAFGLLARELEPTTAAACCAALAGAAGEAGMVGGQVDDLAGDLSCKRGQTQAMLATLQSIHRRKTGAMFNVSVQLGGLVAGADAQEMAALTTYSTHLGLAFQIVDDLLDVSGVEAATGKRVGKDSDQGKLTFPGLIGVDESRRRAAALVDQACAALVPLTPRAGNLEALARFVLERDR